jgi:hypothetical protein
MFAGTNRFRNLRIFNLIAGIAHAIQAVAMLILANDNTFPLTTAFLKFNEETQQLLPAQDVVWDAPLAYFVAAFSAMSAVAHFAVASPVLFDWYRRNLEQGKNPARWIEYSFSASLMIVIIGILFGMYNIAALVVLAGANAGMILLGWDMEVLNQHTEKTNWLPFISGSIIGLMPWIALGIYFVGTIENNTVPDFVYTIFITIFLAFNIFPINMFLQYKKVGPWRNYLFGEAGYIVLSLAAKSLLAWQVYAGALNQPS